MSKIWGIMPAAGSGQRFGASLPKQYAPLYNRTVIEWSLSVLSQSDKLAGLFVAIADHDTHWDSMGVSKAQNIQIVTGGSERADSVLNALMAVPADENDWVIVHDAARPCLQKVDLESLISTAHAHPVGGLLACPVADTLKQVDKAGHITKTIARDHLWRAMTPQMFRYGLLKEALLSARAEGVKVTDEAHAIEQMNLKPCIVPGLSSNIKVTVAEDLKLAEVILQTRQQQSATPIKWQHS